MYNTKKEVDTHVRVALSKLRTESERNLRGFTIAKLYFKINEFTSAEQHVLAYLSVKEDNDQAHKLLGQCYQRLKKPDKALQSFQRSLQLNAKQQDVLVEVCQLLLEDKHLNSTKAKYWCELAESEKVQHDAVFSLRLKLMNKENSETNQVEELIQKEINARPKDVQLRVRLVRNYIEQNKILEAFKYVHNLEMSLNDTFIGSSEWYNIMWLTLSKYEQLPNAKKDWEFWLLIAICLERQVCISFSQSAGTTMLSSITETANLLFNLDQYLFKIAQLSDKLNGQKELISLFLDHYHGQLLLHSASLILKRELLQNKNKWKETVKAVLPLLLLAYQISPPDNRQLWMKHCDEQGKQLIQLWNRESAFRCAQAGRILLSCINDESTNKENGALNNLLTEQMTLWDNSDSLLAQIRQTCSDQHWRRNIFALLFCNSDQKLKEHTSVLVRSGKLSEPVFELPLYSNVEQYEETAQYLMPQSLSHTVYLCLGNDNLAYIRAKYFSGLNFSTQNLSFCGAESLNQLDVETFLYAATIQAKRILEIDRDTFNNYNSGNQSATCRPTIMPFAILQHQLCSEEQSNWWSAAYQVYKNLSSENLLELRSNLQFGIEAVRGINGPKIDMFIVFMLGKIFVSRAQDRVKPAEKTYLEARAENLYKYGLNMLRMHNRGVLEPFRKYFKYAKSNSTIVERQVSSAAEDAVSYLATRFFKKGEYEELIEELNGIQLPFATYLQAEAYRKLDESNKTPKHARRLYLDRASECLNQTLTLLKSTQTDPNHPLNSVIHAELKRLQQSTNKFLNDSLDEYASPHGAHNNSSTYEDAEADLFSESPRLLVNYGGLNRSRRETLASTAALVASPRSTELENLVKQMVTTLSFVKEELVDTIKPEVMSMRKEITSLKEKIANLEDAMKRTRISSNPPSRDDASNVLDDLYIIEDTLQNQLFQHNANQHLSQAANSNMYPATSCCPTQQTAQRIHTPNAMQMQQNVAVAAANAYNSPMFNPNYPMNYYTSQYMLPQLQGTATAGNLLGQQRSAMPIQFVDGTTGLNFNMPPPTTPLMQTAVQDGRVNSLYGMVQPPPQNTNVAQLHLPMPANNTNAMNTGTTPTPQLPTTNIAASTFNKTINNQPVEKGPPANVVITSSDPLPNPNSATIQTQQPTLSVTIPSHHIKQSAVQTPENLMQSNMPFAQSNAGTGGGGFTGFSFGTQSLPSAASLPITSTVNTTSFTSATFNTPSQVVSKTDNTNIVTPLLVNSATSTTTFSFKPQVMQAIQQQQQLQQQSTDTPAVGESHNNTNESTGANDLNDSFTEAEYDPRPDFKPIIPLPDEIDVKTGEENEEEMFCYRAKLFRHVDGEWKERGIGNIKILRDKQGHSRILMRRDQTHKICANHKITKDIKLTTPKDETKGYIWAANDFADEEIKLEMFFVRFKLPDTAKQFHDAFKQAQSEAEKLEQNPPAGVVKATVKPTFGLAKSNVTNFATSTPSTKNDNQTLSKPAASTASSTAAPAANNAVSKTLFSGVNLGKTSTEATKTSTPSLFANFSFGAANTNANIGVSTTTTATTTTMPFANIFSNLNKSNQSSPFATPSTFAISSSNATTPSFIATVTTKTTTTVADASTPIALNKSDTEDDYVPTAQFNPVIALPDLVEVNTGEENEIVLFEHRGKLLRFDKETGEWKERGIGNMKLLQDKNDVNKVRLVMRREQVHKLCCNQRLYKNMAFSYCKNSKTALSWAGQDYSEENLTTELLALRFKTADICTKFFDAIVEAQSKMTVDENAEPADKFKTNDNDTTSKSKNNMTSPANSSETKGFGDAFKPKAGSWSCEQCYVTNGGDAQYCVACDAARDKNAPPKSATSFSLAPTNNGTNSNLPKFSFGFANTTAASTESKTSTFTFGVPTASTAQSSIQSTTTTTSTKSSSMNTGSQSTSTSTSGFGDQFKPKAGSWTCQDCYVSNTGDDSYCKACDAPKDSTVPKKETAATNNVLNLSTNSQKFSFGFAALGGEAVKPAVAGNTGFTFGTNANTTKSGPTFGTKTPLFESNGSTSVSTTTTTDAPKTFSFAPSSANNTATAPLGSLSKTNFTFNLQSKALETPNMPLAAGGEATVSSSPFSLDKKDFNFTLKPKSPGKGNKSPQKHGGGGDADANPDDPDDGYHAEEDEEENNTYFTPVIPLPEKIDVRTGEENEEMLYTHRAKLYRFVDGEWKERGLGDVKILRHCETKKLRVVMRRDQVLKICLNHVLNEDVEYKIKDDKSWLFVVNDFSEGTVELEKFSLRFKTHEIAEGFMKAIKAAIDGTAEVIKSTDSAVNPLTFNTSGNALPKLPIITPANISVSEKKLADELKLPYDFYATKPACNGCRGCDPDKFEFTIVKEDDNEEKTTPLRPLEMPALVMPKQNRLLLKQSALASASTKSPLSADQTKTSSVNTSNTTFSFTAALSSTAKPDDTKSATGGFLFGSSANNSNTLFGGQQSSAEKKTIFGQPSGMIFGNSFDNNQNQEEGAKSFFGGNSLGNAASSGSIFGGKPVFGSGVSPIFGGSGSASTATPTSNPEMDTTKSIFGGTATKTPDSGASLFGSTATFGSGGKNTMQTSIFGGNTNNLNTTNNGNNTVFGSVAANKDKGTSDATVPTFADLTNKSGVVDFASLAAQTKNNTAAFKSTEKPGPGGFIGLTNQNAFSSFMKPNANNNDSTATSLKPKDPNANDSVKSTDNGDNANNDDNYDPYYEPIISLPNEIVLSTGEEDETKLFGERATLFRWDDTNREWKERGVGELKILLHPANQTYRLLLRREQIHKLVLNHAVGATFSFNNMNNNPKSFVWAAMNYAESNEGSLEKLAVRFKKVEIAERFSTELNQCIEAAKKHISQREQN